MKKICASNFSQAQNFRQSNFTLKRIFKTQNLQRKKIFRVQPKVGRQNFLLTQNFRFRIFGRKKFALIESKTFTCAKKFRRKKIET